MSRPYRVCASALNRVSPHRELVLPRNPAARARDAPLAACQTRRVRVVIADDAMLTREGIVRVLDGAGVEVVGEAGEVDGLMRAVATVRPDCAMVDIRMPPTHTDEGIVAAQRIRELHPDVGVLVLSHHVEPGFAMRLLRGASPRDPATCSRIASAIPPSSSTRSGD